MWTALGEKQLSAWGITVSQAEAYGLSEVSDASSIYPEFERAEPCILIPYWNPDLTAQTFMRDGAELPFCRIRYLRDRAKQGFTKQREQRYDQPRGSGIHIYFPMGIEWQAIVADADSPVIVTEGEAKSIVGAIQGLPVLALGGVFNFSLASGEGLCSGLALLVWNGRDTFICFDSDRAQNPGILTAEARLVQELQSNRGAKCALIELPSDGAKKVGLDDFLNKYGLDAFMLLLKNAVSLGVLEAKVVGLNRNVAWVAAEGAIYNLEDHCFIQKHDFVTGSEFGSIHHIAQGGTKRTDPKPVYIAPLWLKSPHAARYGQVLFKPGEGQIVKTDTGKPALNMWDGWRAEYGATELDPRIANFVKFTRWLFQNIVSKDADVDFPIRLLAYKFQNPQEKPALCLTLVSEHQGSGKSLWCDMVARMVQPYSTSINSASLGSEFNPWIERTLIGVINEANAEHLKAHFERLKTMISDKPQQMRDLYRAPRMIESYTMYLMSANDHAAGSFSAEDRRMVVVEAPPPMEDRTLYNYFSLGKGEWIKTGGPAAVLGWLLELDLEGWEPPAKAPETQEKYNAYKEGLSPVQELARQMREAVGENAVTYWLQAAEAWNEKNATSNNQVLVRAAQASNEGLKRFQIRPWYTPEELSLVFPHIAAIMQGARFEKMSTAGKVARELRNAGVGYLKNLDNPKGFEWEGQLHSFMLVANMDEYKHGITQNQFDSEMARFPRFGRRRG